jgi:hypothetical protein
MSVYRRPSQAKGFTLVVMDSGGRAFYRLEDADAIDNAIDMELERVVVTSLFGSRARLSLACVALVHRVLPEELEAEILEDEAEEAHQKAEEMRGK